MVHEIRHSSTMELFCGKIFQEKLVKAQRKHVNTSTICIQYFEFVYPTFAFVMQNTKNILKQPYFNTGSW